MVCADTDFIVDLDRGRADAISKLDELDNRGETLFTTAINIAELYHGAQSSKDKMKALGRVEKLISGFSILDFDFDSAKLWGKLAEQLKSNAIGEIDLFIASIAISNKQTLLTRNVKHFERVPGLTIESW